MVERDAPIKSPSTPYNDEKIIGTVQVMIQGLVLSLHHVSGTLPDCCPVPPSEGQDEADVPLAGEESDQLGRADRAAFTSQHLS